jgi:hypothetical protein
MAELLVVPALVSRCSSEVVSYFLEYKVDIYSVALELVSLTLSIDGDDYTSGSSPNSLIWV